MEANHCKYVTMQYTMTLADGQVADRSPEGEPLGFIFGTAQVLPAVEEKVRGLEPGQRTTFTLSAEQAFGARDETLIKSVPLATFPTGQSVEPGMVFVAQSPLGEVPFHVESVSGEEVRVDFNHPLAGESLRFDIRIEGVRDLSPTEIEVGPPVCRLGRYTR